jgi:ubiquinone/menaquinone biosynthesis C-methylase UbiE
MTDPARPHDELVTDQFSPNANAYVTSVVHATGDDLVQLQDAVRGRGLGRMLDLGCGGGHAGFAVAPYVAELVACDLSAAMLQAVMEEAARRGLTNIRTQQASAEQLPFADASFDAVVTRFSAHHWGDMAAGVAEAARVVRPGGLGMFLDTGSPGGAAALDTHLQAIELLRDPSHVRDYAEAEWRAALSEAGFTVTSVTWRKLRMEFSSWVARIRTPPVLADAVRLLQTLAATPVREHFAIEDDGSFLLDTIAIEALRRS